MKLRWRWWRPLSFRRKACRSWTFRPSGPSRRLDPGLKRRAVNLLKLRYRTPQRWAEMVAAEAGIIRRQPPGPFIHGGVADAVADALTSRLITAIFCTLSIFL